MGKMGMKARGGGVVRLDVGCATVRACVSKEPRREGKLAEICELLAYAEKEQGPVAAACRERAARLAGEAALARVDSTPGCGVGETERERRPGETEASGRSRKAQELLEYDELIAGEGAVGWGNVFFTVVSLALAAVVVMELFH